MDYINAKLLSCIYIIIGKFLIRSSRNCPPYVNAAARSDTMEPESEILPPGGDAAITRQRFQRAFAQEFLCSLAGLKEYWATAVLRHRRRRTNCQPRLCTKASNHKPVTTRLVRRHLWMSPGGFSMSRRDSDREKVPAALYDRLTDTPTYAARMYKVQANNFGVSLSLQVVSKNLAN